MNPDIDLINTTVLTCVYLIGVLLGATLAITVQSYRQAVAIKMERRRD